MTKRASALALASKGFRVFLLDVNAKTPIIEDFPAKATADPVAVERAWTDPFGESRDNNIGISTDNLLVLDFDVKVGREVMEREFDAFNKVFKFKHVVLTQSGGCHVYYRLPEGIRTANTSKKLGASVDTRSFHGYVVGAGSDVERSHYSWLVSIPDDFAEPESVDDLALAPQELIEACGAPSEKAPQNLNIEWDTPAAISLATDYLLTRAPEAVQGQGGDEITYKVACRVRDFGVSHDAALLLMDEHWNQTKASPPWPLEELDRKIGNAYTYAKGSPHAPGSEFDPVEINTPQPATKSHTDAQNSDWPNPDLLLPFDVAGLPKREWVVPGILAKSFLTGLVAPSGAGKTQWLAQLMLAIAASRPEAIGAKEAKTERIWCWNQEDDLIELKRRIAAACTHYEIKWEDLADRLFLNSGAHKPLVLVARDPHGKLRQTKYVKQMAAHLIRENIGVLIIDPFVEFHEADENNNVEMRLVAAALRQIAVEAKCAVMFGHHTKKPDGASADGFAGNADSGRGASSLQGVTRVMLTLYAMTVKDAKAYGVKEDDRHLYVRLDGAKSNISASTSGNRPQWLRRVSVPLGEGGEEVGVLAPTELNRIESRVAREEGGKTRKEIEADRASGAVADAIEEMGEDKVKWRDIKEGVARSLNWSFSKLTDWVTDTANLGKRVPAGYGREIDFGKRIVGVGYNVKLILSDDYTPPVKQQSGEEDFLE